MSYKDNLMNYFNSRVLEPFDTRVIIHNLIHNNSFVALSDGNFLSADENTYSVCQNIQPYDSSIEDGFAMIKFYIDKFPIVKNSNDLYGFEFIVNDKAYIQAIQANVELEKELVREEIKVPDFYNYERQNNSLSF